ncbi:MAG: DUF3253 domain-containing protein [Terrimicrobiaceae bacterium]|nr:DUF3253 domain-containing protein [Terrimicrobiaceae bacterium]
MISDDEIRREIETLAASRPGTFCPSEVARRLTTDWRPLMPAVRAVAAVLVREGRLRCTRRGRAVDPESAGGPIRLGR